MSTSRKAVDFSVKTKRSSTTSKKVSAKKAPKKPSSSSSLKIQDKTSLKAKKVLKEAQTDFQNLGTQKKALPHKAEKTLAVRAKMNLALLSPYRFPLDIDKLAVSTARYGGVFFVLVGALFTLLLTDNTLYGQSQLATSYPPASLVESSGSTGGNTATVDTKPAAEFIVNNPGNVTGGTQIKVKVPYATSVKLMAYFKTQARDITLGTPSKVSSDTWEMTVNTAQYDDGEYKLKAIITNAYGTYEAVDDTYFTIANKSSDTNDQGSSSGENVTNTTTDVQPTEVDEVVQAVLFVNKNESDSELRFEITVRGADDVRMYAKDKSGVRKLIGYAYKSDSTTWKFKWPLEEVVAGTYEVQAEVEGNNDLTSNSVFVKVVNGVTALTPLSTPVSSTTTVDTPLAPEITITLDADEPLQNVVPITIKVENALGVEMHAVPKSSLVQKYLGSAYKVDDDVWSFRWDTKTMPNGEYTLLAQVKNAYGAYSEETERYTVQNPIAITYTEQQQQNIEKLTAVIQDEGTPTMLQIPSVKQSTEQDSEEDEVNKTDELASLVSDYHEEIDKELQRLASALRVKDENAVFEIKERLNKLKRQIVNAHVGSTAQDELLSMIDEFLAQTIRRVEEDVVRIEKVIEERTAQQAEADSDNDGVSDYDEVALYGTDPYSADSDGDGFTDGAEILKGYNPLDPSSEVLIAYESPKETGIIRDDIFKVDAIVTATPNEEVEEDKAVAILTGTGLPNSFVTLYIFSTPVVVTLKTDSDGNWNYRFDKELDDGEHQVYVGVTDNAGKIVAKSQPFTFVKEAQAFTAVNDTIPEFTPEVAPDSFGSKYAMYLVLSISVVAIGLVLILLGWHLDARQRRFGTLVENQEVAV